MLALSFVLMTLTPVACVEFYDVNTPTEGLAEWKELTFQMPMRFFSGYTQQLYIHRNGFISNTTVAPAIVRIPSDKTVISAYNLPYSSFTTWHVDQGNLNHIEKAKDDVRKYTNDAFTPTTVVIATYNSFSRYSGNNNTFQIVLASDNTKTYGILLYKRLEEGGAIVGYNDGHCNVKMLTSTVFSQQLAQTSNVGERGKHIIDLNIDTVCHYSDIYPHSSAKKELVEDTRISYIWPLQRGFKIFGANYSTFYLTPGGLITIDKPISDLERSRFDLEKHNGGLMCPYWADLSTKTSGKIFYEETNDNSLLQTASTEVSSFDKRYERFIATNMAIVTFDNVPEPGNITRNNSFQTVVVGGINDTFMIVKYTRLDSLSLGNIYRDKDGICIRDTFSTYKDSVGLVNQSNTGITGKFIFRLTSVSCSQSDLFINLFYQVGVNAESTKMFSSSQLFTDTEKISVHLKYTIDMHVYRNGMISYMKLIHDVITKNNPDITTTFVAAYNLNYDASSNYVITVSKSSEPNLLHEINKDIRRAGDKTFNGTRVFIIAYEDMATHGIPYSKNSFQLVLIEDGNTMYAIFNYKRLDGVNAFVGFSSLICIDYYKNSMLIKEDSRDLEITSNVGIPGRFVYKFFERCLTSPMYDYGVSNGDTLVPAESGAIKIDLPKVMPLFSKSLQYIYANNYGLIGDQETLPELQISLPNKENIIAIYNLRRRSEFYYRVTHQPFILLKASKDVHKFTSSDEFEATQAVIVSFVNFGDKDGEGLNTAQVVVVTDGVTTYAIFNYERLDMMKGTTGFTNAGCSWDSIRENQKVHELALRKNLSNVDILGRNLRLLTPKECKPTSIYAYGEQFGHALLKQLSLTSFSYEEFTFRNDILPVFGSYHNNLYITRHGAITFRSSFNGNDVHEFENHPTFALFMESNSIDPAYGGEIYFYIDDDAGFIRVILDDIKDYVPLSFKPKIFIVITFSKVGNKHNERTTSLQAIFLTDQQTTTYVIVQYLTLGLSGAFTGMIDPNCEHRMKQYQSDHDVLNNGDTRQKGKYIFQLECREMNLSTATSPPVGNSTTRNKKNTTSVIINTVETKAPATTKSKMIIIGGSAVGVIVIMGFGSVFMAVIWKKNV